MIARVVLADDAKLLPSILSAAEIARAVTALSLTPRQADIVRLLIRGARDKQIASTLRISVPTVRSHLRQIFTRHDVFDRTELVLLAFSAALGDRTPHQIR